MTELDWAGLLLRVAVGLTMMAHGYNHVWGGGGLAGTSRWFHSLGMRPAKLHAALSGAGEMGAGAALTVGLVTPVAGAFIVGAMMVAGVTAHRRNGFFVFKEGYEYVLMISVVCAAVGVLGPGSVSLDAALGLHTAFSGFTGFTLSTGMGVLGAALLLAATYRPNRAR